MDLPGEGPHPKSMLGHRSPAFLLLLLLAQTRSSGESCSAGRAEEVQGTEGGCFLSCAPRPAPQHRVGRHRPCQGSVLCAQLAARPGLALVSCHPQHPATGKCPWQSHTDTSCASPRPAAASTKGLSRHLCVCELPQTLGLKTCETEAKTVDASNHNAERARDGDLSSKHTQVFVEHH